MKYYYKELNGIIQYLGKSKKVPKSCVEITKSDYENYMEIIHSVENKEGYLTVLTLYTNYTSTLDYIKEEISEEHGLSDMGTD